MCWRVGLRKLLSPTYKLEKKVNWIFEHVSSLLQDVCSVLREMKERSNGRGEMSSQKKNPENKCSYLPFKL